jgi:hypothetical protein
VNQIEVRSLAILIVLAIMALLWLFGILHAAERTPDDWAALVAGIDRDVAQADAEGRRLPNIDAEDRRFIRKMANELFASADARPTVAQGTWLLKIREWVDAGEKR